MKTINLVMINKYHGLSIWTFEDTMLALQQLLRAAGYDCQITANFVDPSPNTVNVLFGVGSHFSHPYAEVAAVAQPHNTIIFNGEQLGSSSDLITREYLEFLSRYVTFDWSESNIDDIRHRVPQLRALEVPLLPSPGLCVANGTPWELKYDLAFYGAYNERRKKLVAELEQEGVSIKHISGFYGAALASQLLECRYVLNMHAYETDHLEVNRCLRPLAMGIPIISEDSTLPSLGDWQDSGIIYVPTEGFGKGVRRVLDTPDQHAVAARKAILFTHRSANADYIRKAMDAAIAELASLNA